MMEAAPNVSDIVAQLDETPDEQAVIDRGWLLHHDVEPDLIARLSNREMTTASEITSDTCSGLSYRQVFTVYAPKNKDAS